MNYYSKIVVIIIVIISLIIPTSYAQDSTDRTIISEHPLISSKIRNMVDGNEKLGNKRNITLIQTNINTLQKELVEKYEGQMVLTNDPQTEQEKISQAMDVLSRYLCLHRQAVLTNYSEEDYYNPSVRSADIEINQGSCYRNTTLLRQEGIRYYTLPEVGTLQTIPLGLLKDLGYSTYNLERYLESDDLRPSSSDAFFFEGSANKEIIPLMDLTYLESMKSWKRKYDKVKVIAYAETTNYPFIDGNIMIAIFAQKDNHLIKITTPYGKLHHDLLGTVMNMTQQLFIYSIHEDIRDSVLLSKYYDNAYTSVAQAQGLPTTVVMKNLVHYYLSALWQYDEQPEGFAHMIGGLVDKDIPFVLHIQSALAELEAFL